MVANLRWVSSKLSSISDREVRVLKRSRIGAVVTLAAVAAMVSATPAFAEGSFTSYLGGVAPGFDSRTWTKNVSYDVSTTVFLH